MTTNFKNMSKEEFCARFRAKILLLVHPSQDKNDALEAYIAETAPTYWEDLDQRAEGPEECACADHSYWEEEE